MLLYEMMGFRTPFYDKNRKMMFHGIITCEPQFPIFFSDEARRTTLFSRLAAHVYNRIRLSVRIGDQRHGTTRRNRRRILRRGRGMISRDDAAHPEWRPVFTRRRNESSPLSSRAVSFFSAGEARAVLRGLLHKSPTERLGSGKEGAGEIKAHPFFAELDFEALYNRQIAAPFKPEVTSEHDVKCVTPPPRRALTSATAHLRPTRQTLRRRVTGSSPWRAAGRGGKPRPPDSDEDAKRTHAYASSDFVARACSALALPSLSPGTFPRRTRTSAPRTPSTRRPRL